MWFIGIPKMTQLVWIKSKTPSGHFKICKWKGEEFVFWASVYASWSFGLGDNNWNSSIRNFSQVQFLLMVSRKSRKVSKVNRGGQIQEFTKSRIWGHLHYLGLINRYPARCTTASISSCAKRMIPILHTKVFFKVFPHFEALIYNTI